MAKHLIQTVANGSYGVGTSTPAQSTAVFYCCNSNDGNVHHFEDSQSLRSSEDEISNAELGLAEDHFALSKGHFGLSTMEELEMAIEQCKEFILEAPEKSERRKNLVKKLIKLRMKLQELKEGPEVVPPDICLVLNHKFEKKKMEKVKVKRYCEKCNGNIWGVLNVWYQCQECKFSCHERCLNSITRVCASVKVQESPVYIMNICPEVGMSSQNFRCAECRSAILPKIQSPEARLCDYNGQYYCPHCHWNSIMITPARVLHNWDFEPRKVSRASKQFLTLMRRKAVLNVQEINPMLFTFVEELSLVKKLREEILTMKKYFLSCKDALENKILLQLSPRQHFVDSTEMYSMQDLEDIHSGELLEFLNVVHSSFVKHIKQDCKACQGKGYICQICNSDEVIFPFDDSSSTCRICWSVFHKDCFNQKDRACPKCQRLAKQMPITNPINANT